MDRTADLLFEYLKNVLYHPDRAHLAVEELPEDYQKLGQGLLLLDKYIQEEREFTKALARGDLSLDPPSADNILASSSKALQSSLRHLTWQTQQVAKGDYSQQVDFLGDFSKAFNTMTRQLSERTARLVEEKNTLYDMAYIDPLTGLNNRRYAMELMEGWLREGTPFLLSFIDVDYLKYCNDTYGHDSGDRYLIDVTNALKIMRCELCRIGGDEFLLLTKGTDVEEHDRQLAHLREFLQNQAGVPYPQSFSFASCAVPEHPERTLEECMKETDARMYEYKAKNKQKLTDVVHKDDRI